MKYDGRSPRLWSGASFSSTVLTLLVLPALYRIFHRHDDALATAETNLWNQTDFHCMRHGTGADHKRFRRWKNQTDCRPEGWKAPGEEAPRAEFLVQKDRSVAITFYDDALKPVAAVDQNAVIWANAKSGRVKLETEKKDGMLISRQPFPEGEGYNVVVQLKSKPEAKAQSFKIKYHTEPCEKCKLAEYAYICPEEADHGHEHKPGEKGHKH